MGGRLAGATFVALLATMSAARTVAAQSINISTGRSGSGVLAYGATDASWTMSVNGGAFASAVVIHPADQCCGMASVDATRARWINNVTNPNATFPNGTPDGWNNATPTIFRRTFDLTGYDLSTVGLSGIWRLADGGSAVLNGTTLFSSPTSESNNWAADNPFAVATGSALFTSGINTLEFRALTINQIYDGLYLDATVTGRLSTTVPEPATGGLLAGGVVVLLAMARRRGVR